MICYPDNLNEINDKLNDATVAWLKAADKHNDNEAHLRGVVDELRIMQDKEEGKLRAQGYTLLYDYDNHRYLAVTPMGMACIPNI